MDRLESYGVSTLTIRFEILSFSIVADALIISIIIASASPKDTILMPSAGDFTVLYSSFGNFSLRISMMS